LEIEVFLVPERDLFDSKLQNPGFEGFPLGRTELKPNRLQAIHRAESGIVVHDTQGEVGPDAKDIDFLGFLRCRATYL
jgi:hypothetical protein